MAATVVSPKLIQGLACPEEEAPCTAGCRNLEHLVRPARLLELNALLARAEPRVILQWLASLRVDGGRIVQFTSFGLSGVVITHLLEQVGLACPVAFVDTLHHFDETLALRDHYVAVQPTRHFHTYTPEDATTRAEFEAKYGVDLWKNDPAAYDYLVKIEPTFRALADLDAKVWITGRRRSQGGERTALDVIEVQPDGRIKINPLAHWSWDKTLAYARANGIAYNPLIDRGYKSIGDIMTTEPTAPGASERSGRWAGHGKSECGMHNRLHQAARRKSEQPFHESYQEQSRRKSEMLPALHPDDEEQKIMDVEMHGDMDDVQEEQQINDDAQA